jgi:isopenicillin-N N-acyltransferase-like protein
VSGNKRSRDRESGLTTGIADATEIPLSSIVALNVRTEVAFGLYNDGCTSVAFHSPAASFLAQNWDWKVAQAPNLINLSINATGRPGICMITEAGIIGKIGLSSAGVGVCLNAIAALGVAHDKLPVHLALRAALDWSGELDAAGIAQRLTERGVASAGHILLADDKQAFGLEVSSLDVLPVPKTENVRGGAAVLHSNHYIVEHPGVKLTANFLQDSPQRLARIDELLRSDEGQITADEVTTWLSDECGFPGSICRDAKSFGGSATLFSIVMDLKKRTARVREGKPTSGGELYILEPK